MFLVLFALTIPAANWLIGHVGTACVTPQGPCVVPVAPGLMAPSGVMLVGVALVLARSGAAAARHGPLRAGDPVRQRPVGAAGAGVARPRLGDGVPVFRSLPISRSIRRLARRRLVAAVVASSLVGLIVDSIVFLWLAFGSLDFLAGQVVGKSWMVLLSIPFVAWLRRRDERLGITPGMNSAKRGKR